MWKKERKRDNQISNHIFNVRHARWLEYTDDSNDVNGLKYKTLEQMKMSVLAIWKNTFIILYQNMFFKTDSKSRICWGREFQKVLEISL